MYRRSPPRPRQRKRAIMTLAHDVDGPAYRSFAARRPAIPEPHLDRGRPSPAPAALSLATPGGGAHAAASPARTVAMAQRHTLAQRLAERFDLDTALTVATTTLKKAQLAVTRIASARRNRPGPRRCRPSAPDLIHLQLQDTVAELWAGGERAPAAPLPAGSIVITDLEQACRVDLRAGFDTLLVHVPRLAFEELADDHGAPRVNALAAPQGTIDAVAHHLGRALLPSLDRPHRRPAVLRPCRVRAARPARDPDGRLEQEPRRRAGALTAWQERVAKAALVADLGKRRRWPRRRPPAACRWVASRAPFGRPPACRPTGGCAAFASNAPRSSCCRRRWRWPRSPTMRLRRPEPLPWRTSPRSSA